MRGRGVSAASRSSRSTGSNRSAVVPSLHSAFRVSSTRPSVVRVSRSCDRWPEHVARELFEPVAVVRCDGDVGVQVEALEVGLAAAGGGHPGRARYAPDLQHPRPGPRQPHCRHVPETCQFCRKLEATLGGIPEPDRWNLAHLAARGHWWVARVAAFGRGSIPPASTLLRTSPAHSAKTWRAVNPRVKPFTSRGAFEGFFGFFRAIPRVRETQRKSSCRKRLRGLIWLLVVGRHRSSNLPPSALILLRNLVGSEAVCTFLCTFRSDSVDEPCAERREGSGVGDPSASG